MRKSTEAIELRTQETGDAAGGFFFMKEIRTFLRWHACGLKPKAYQLVYRASSTNRLLIPGTLAHGIPAPPEQPPVEWEKS